MRRLLPAAAFAIIVVIASFALPRLDVLYLESPHTIAAGSAQALLAAIASGTITLTAVVFSLAFVILQFSVSSYSPRLAPVLSHDSAIYISLAIFVATFTYALGTLASVDLHGHGIVPRFSIFIVMALLILSMGMLVRLVQRFGRLEIYRVLRLIHNAGREIIERLPALDGPDETPLLEVSAKVSQTFTFSSRSPQYVVSIDREALNGLSDVAKGRIVVVSSIGDCVSCDSILARAYETSRDIPPDSVIRAFRFGRERSLKTDLAYAIRLLVDTAIRALSPAINDPMTAVQALDEIESLLCRLANRKLIDGSVWGGYVHLAFDDIRLCGAHQPIVMRRMRAAVIAVSRTTPAGSRREAVQSYLERIDDAIASAGFDSLDAAVAGHADRQGMGVCAEVWQ
jgi:uncharacterized membrane protein